MSGKYKVSFALACASHTPVMFDGELASAETCASARSSFERMARFVSEFEPDLIIEFGPDHFNGFSYSLMPSFCLGAAARSAGDWNLPRINMPVPEQTALDLLDHVRRDDFDVALSYSMVLDHGFVQMWDCMFGEIDRYPVVPIFINCAAPPLPSYRRVRMLGKAVGEFARKLDKRVLFAASGGLSHDPPIGDIRTAKGGARQRMLGLVTETAEDQAVREARVREFGREVHEGRGRIMPLNPDWDAMILDMLAQGRWDFFDCLDPVAVSAKSGSAANEILCWIAAAAAMNACSPYRVVQQDYAPAPGWIAGVGHLAAIEAG